MRTKTSHRDELNSLTYHELFRTQAQFNITQLVEVNSPCTNINFTTRTFSFFGKRKGNNTLLLKTTPTPKIFVLPEHIIVKKFIYGTTTVFSSTYIVTENINHPKRLACVVV